MTITIVALLGAITLGVGFISMGVYSILLEQEKQTKTLRQVASLQLNPRTRISTASMQSGAVTQEQSLERLGRASAARRIVVGGDPDSELYTKLDAFTKHDEEEEIDG